ncbi:MAG: RNA polymerase sigma-70 factor [Bacteroidota bacterium]
MESDKLKRLKRGDVVVFEELFNSYYPSLLIMARTLVLDHRDAEDIVHNVFIHLWEKRESLEIRESLSFYLGKSVRNASLNLLKHQMVKDKHRASVLQKSLETDFYKSPSDILIEQEQVEKIKRIIDQIPDKSRQIFRMSRFHGMRNQEIADLLDISVRTVENQIFRALKILKRGLKS